MKRSSLIFVLVVFGQICLAQAQTVPSPKKVIKCSLYVSATDLANYNDSCSGTYEFDNGSATLEFPCQTQSNKTSRYSAVLSIIDRSASDSQNSGMPESNAMLRIFDQDTPTDVKITESTNYFGNGPLPDHFRISLSPTEQNGNQADYQANLVCDRVVSSS